MIDKPVSVSKNEDRGRLEHNAQVTQLHRLIHSVSLGEFLGQVRGHTSTQILSGTSILMQMLLKPLSAH